MENIFKSFCILFLIISALNISKAQSNRYLQLDLNGGASLPIGAFNDEHMFAGKGLHFGGGFDYFFNKTIGFGFSGGYFTNESENLFRDYINHKYFEYPAQNNMQSWNTKYVLFGPTYKVSLKKFEFDLFVKGGLSQIQVPNLIFNKRFFNQSYEVYQFSGASKDWQYAWTAGTRIIYKVNHWLGVQAKADYFATQYMSKVNYDYTYRNATDGNRNGIIEDSEYFESQKINTSKSAELSALNVNMGIIIQLGRTYHKNIKMVPELPEEALTDDTLLPTLTDSTYLVEQTIPTNTVEPIAIPAETIEETETKNVVVTKTTMEPEIPLVNANEEAESKKAEEERKILEPVNMPVTTYDAPESTYDAEAAEFLHKAGESYFAANDFENALPCFNKLKADPNYPRAKYMFALSLCAMGNCEEGKREYKDFAKTYKETDSRTLEIIFASQFEKCALGNKAKAKSSALPKVQNATTQTNDGAKTKTTLAKEYRIQFIAIKKPNASFPGVAKVGTVETEFFPNKSVYRYTLADYQSVNAAADDLAKVRKMGFRDAFIAVYENGQRVNTIYHKR